MSRRRPASLAVWRSRIKILRGGGEGGQPGEGSRITRRLPRRRLDLVHLECGQTFQHLPARGLSWRRRVAALLSGGQLAAARAPVAVGVAIQQRAAPQMDDTH